jgi:hypothetical protein
MKYKYLYLLLAAVFAFSCTKPDDILDDFQVHISPTFYKYVVEIDVEDLTDPSIPIANNVNVSVTGSNADAVFNIDGTKNYEVNYGTLQLMIAKGYEPSIGSPLIFRVVLEADGYQKTELPMSIGLEDYFVADLAQMLNLNNLPNSIGANVSNGGIDPITNTLTEPLVINTGSPDSISRIKITIPVDVKFLDENGNEISAKRNGTGLNVNVLSLSDTSQSAQQAMPNGSGLVQIVTEGASTDTLLLEQTGTFNITMDVDGVPVRGFSGGKMSGGVTTRIPISAGTENPEFGRDYEEGDSVGMMSLSDGDAAWAVENTSFVVQKDSITGDLFVDPTITHLSWWRWRWRRWYRPVYRRFGAGAYYADAANGNGAISGDLWTRFSYRYFGRWRSSWFRIRGNFGTNYRFNPKRLIRTSRVYSSIQLFPSSSINPANFNLSYENANYFGYQMKLLRIEPKVTPPSIGYRLYCGSSNILVSPPAGVKMYFRKTGSGAAYEHLYTFTQQNVGITFATFPKLENNVFYDFRAQLGETQKDTANVRVLDGSIYEVTMPNSACTALGL